MSRPIDEKIVAMKMDNSDFKKKATETTSLFGKLRQSLDKIPGVNLGKISEGLNGITKSAQRVDLGSIGTAVDNISGRFTTLGVIATTALVNITNRAIDAGASIVKSLGMEQAIAGFQEYELKIGSIGTVLSNTEWAGTSLKDVNKAFAELNDYADDTIYNFGQMTANIGRFTAAGVTLGDSTIAIKGLGNLAAVSGSTSAQLDTAMYQMSQALASGKLNLMDWNSMVNAGMGGKKTQDALLATAKAMGKNVDMSEGFRNSISDGWLTSEVFLETLKKFGADESMTEAATKVRTFTQMIDSLQEGIGSGWAESWEIIFGDFDEATKMWTGVSNFFAGFFDKQATARNAMLRAVFDGGALKFISGAVKGIATPIIQMFSAIGDGFKKAFPPLGATGILDFLKGITDLTSGLKLSEKTISNIETIFAGFFSIFAIGGKIVAGAVSAVVGLLPSFSGLGSKLLELIAKIAGIPLAFNEASDSTKSFGSAMEVVKKIASGVSTGLEFIVGAILLTADAISTAFSILTTGDFSGGPWAEDSKIVDWLFNIREALSEFSSAVAETWSILSKGDFTGKGPWAEDSKIVDWLFKTRDALIIVVDYIKGISLSSIGESFSKAVDVIRKSVAWVIDGFKQMGEVIKKFMPETSTLLAGGFGVGMLTVVGLVLKKMWSIFKAFDDFGGLSDSVGKVVDGVKDVLDEVGGALEAFSLEVKTRSLVNIAIAVAILAGSLFVLSKLDGAEIAKSLSAVVGSLGALVLAMAALTKWDLTGAGFMASIQIIGLAIAITIMAVALKSLSKMEWGEILKGITGLVGVVGAFSGALILISKFGSAQIGTSVLQMAVIAGSIWVLTQSFTKISEMSWGQIAKGFIGLGSVVGIFAGALILMSRFGSVQIGTSILQLAIIAGSIWILTQSFVKMTTLDWGKIGKGLAGLASAMGIFAGVIVIMSKFGAGAIASTSLQFLAIAGAMLIMVEAIRQIGKIDPDKLSTGLKAIMIILGSIGLFTVATSSAGLLSTGAGLVLLAAALNLMVLPIGALGSMKLSTLAKGLGALAIALGMVAGFAMLMSGLALPAVGLILMAVALNMLVIPIAALGSMSLKTIGIGLLAMAAGILVIGGAAALLGLAAAPMLAGAGALFIVGLAAMAFGAAMALAGLGLAAFSTALVTLAAMTGTAIITIVSMLGTLIAGIATLIPEAVKFMVKLINSMLDALNEHMPQIADKVSRLMIDLLTVLAEYQPQFTEKITEIMIGMMGSISENLPKMYDAFANMVIVIIEAMAESVRINGPRFTSAFMILMAEVAIVMVDAGLLAIEALFGWIPGVQEATFAIGVAAESTIRENFNAQLVASEKGSEFASTLAGTSGDAKVAGETVGSSAEAGADTADLSTIGETKGVNYSDSLASTLDRSVAAGETVGGGAVTGVEKISLVGAGENAGLGFARGMNSESVMSRVIGAGKAMAIAAKGAVEQWLDMRSPSRVMTTDGEFFSEGFAIGIMNMTGSVVKSAKTMAMKARDSINTLIDSINPSLEAQLDVNVAMGSYDAPRFDPVTVPVSMRPDPSFAKGLAGSVSSSKRQNDSNRDRTDELIRAIQSNSNDDEVVELLEEVVIAVRSGQVIIMDGKQVAKSVEPHLSNIQDRNASKENRGKGLLI